MNTQCGDALKSYFPIFEAYPDYVYLDNAATSHKPKSVIDALSTFLATKNATIHRGVYRLSQEATDLYQESRDVVSRFIGAKKSCELVFTKGCTESLNLVAHGIGALVKEGQQILISEIEHHANWVCWQRLAKEKRLDLRTIPVDDSGLIQLSELEALLQKQDTALVSVMAQSNVLGVVQPIKTIIDLAKKYKALSCIDGAQYTAHFPVNVQELDCDFYCFSSHKLYGPTGIGLMYAKESVLERLAVYQVGGDMIDEVFLDNITYAPLPNRFEAGTPPIAEAIALKKAIAFIEEISLSTLADYELSLTKEALAMLSARKGYHITGGGHHSHSIISFTINDIHPHDVGSILDGSNIAIRAGHHCSQPTMRRFGKTATNRISFGCYNTLEDIKRLDKGLDNLEAILR